MGKTIGKRIITTIPTICIISLVLFALFKLIPSDPVALSMPDKVKVDQYELVYAQTKEKMGFHDAIPTQYTRWVTRMITGDMGMSLLYKQPVAQVIAKPLLNTLALNAMVLIVSFVISLCAGMYCGLHPHTRVDALLQKISLLGMSIPSFFIALILIYIFAFTFHLLPSSGMAGRDASIGSKLAYICLPVLSMSIVSISGTFRYVRATMIEIFQADYILGAKARGLSRRRILYHGFRNACVPLITICMQDISTLLYGSVLIESIFAYDGIGRVLIMALQRRDFMLVIALNLIYAMLYIACNLIADILYMMVDPRMRIS